MNYPKLIARNKYDGAGVWVLGEGRNAPAVISVEAPDPETAVTRPLQALVAHLDLGEWQKVTDTD